MAHRRMNSRTVNPAYQFSVHSPPSSPNPLAKPLPTMPASPMSWVGSRSSSPHSSPSTSSNNSLDSLPLPLGSFSSFESSKEDYFYRDEDEDVFIGTPIRKVTTGNKSWLRKRLATLLTRRPRPRTTFVLLLLLSMLSLYIIFTSSSLSLQSHPISLTHDTPSAQQVGDNEPAIVVAKPNLQLASKVNKKLFKGSRPPLVLSPAEELAALTSFLIALPQNVLPGDVDGNKPIDPQLILDFDVRGGRKARAELQVVRTQVWENNPVVIYAKRYAPHTRLLLGSLLESLNVHPPPAVFYVDERHDGDILVDALQRVSSSLAPQPLIPSLSSGTSTSALPMVLIGGQLIGIPYEEMTKYPDENDNAAHKIMLKTALKNAIHAAGGETSEGRRKKKGH